MGKTIIHKPSEDTSVSNAPRKKRYIEMVVTPAVILTEEKPQTNIEVPLRIAKDKFKVFTATPLDENIPTRVEDCEISTTLLVMNDRAISSMIKKRMQWFRYQSKDCTHTTLTSVSSFEPLALEVLMNVINAKPLFKEFLVLTVLSKLSMEFIHKSFNAFGINVSINVLSKAKDVVMKEYQRLKRKDKKTNETNKATADLDQPVNP